MTSNNEDSSRVDATFNRTFEEKVTKYIELTLGYLGFAIVLIYPIGLATIWFQLLDNYDSITAFYAASLIPTTVVIGSTIVDIFFWSIASFGATIMISAIVSKQSTDKLYDAVYGDEDWYKEFREEKHTRLERIRTRRMYIYSFLTAALLPFMLAPSLIPKSTTNLYLYIAYITVSFGGGLVGILVEVPTSPDGPLWRQYVGIAIIYTAIVLGAICLAGMQDLSLPTVVFDSHSAVGENKLLSHSEGYWYILDGEGSLYAIPDDKAGEVQILKQVE